MVLLMTTAPTVQAMPVEDAVRVKETIVFENTGFADFLSDACGVPNVTVMTTEKVNLWVGNGTEVGHVGFTTVITNSDTGQYIVESASFRIETTFSETLGSDGLLTIDFEDTFTGVPIKWRAPGQGVIARDAGSINFAGQLVIDTTIDPAVEDPVVSFNEVITQKGPHPFADNFGPTDEQAEAFCTAIGGTPQL